MDTIGDSIIRRHLPAFVFKTKRDWINVSAAISCAIDKTIADEREAKWLPIETAPRDGSPLRLFAKSLIDPDFNVSGSVEGYWQDDDGWVGAVWDSCHDLWERRQIKPSHFQPLPMPPAPFRWEIANRNAAIRRDDTADTQTGDLK